jgi:hypothetical protein
MDSVLIHSSVHKSLPRPGSVKSLHYFCSTMQGSRSVFLTNGSGWPKNLWILRTLLKALGLYIQMSDFSTCIKLGVERHRFVADWYPYPDLDGHQNEYSDPVQNNADPQR